VSFLTRRRSATISCWSSDVLRFVTSRLTKTAGALRSQPRAVDAIAPQCGRRNVCHEVGRCGTGGSPAAFRIRRNGRAAHSMGDGLERALDPRIAPRRILRRHPDNDEPTDLAQDTAPTGSPDLLMYVHFWEISWAIPQQHIRRRDRGDLP
jgi:hypothetical protein